MTPPITFDSIATMPDDPDVRDVAEYVSGLMTDAQAEAFEARLAVDDALFQRVGPFLEAWVSPNLLPAEVEIGEAIERERAAKRVRSTARRHRVRITLGSLTAAASVIFGIVQSGVVQLAFRDHANVPATSTQAKAPTKVGTDSKRTTVASSPKPPVHRTAPSIKPTRLAVQLPKKVDSAAERVVAELVTTPVPSTSVIASSAPVSSQPEVPWVPPVVGHARDTVDVGSDGPPTPLTVPSRLASWLRWLLHRH
jgi:hypothetical protein